MGFTQKTEKLRNCNREASLFDHQIKAKECKALAQVWILPKITLVVSRFENYLLSGSL